LESGATIACALDRHRQSASAHRLEVGHVQPHGLLDRTDDFQNVFARHPVGSAEVTPHKELGFRCKGLFESRERRFRIQWLGRENSHAFLPGSGRASRVI